MGIIECLGDSKSKLFITLLDDVVSGWSQFDQAGRKHCAEGVARFCNARPESVEHASGEKLRQCIALSWRRDESLLARMLMGAFTTTRQATTNEFYALLGAELDSGGSLTSAECARNREPAWFHAAFEQVPVDSRDEILLWLWVVATTGVSGWRAGAREAANAIEIAQTTRAAESARPEIRSESETAQVPAASPVPASSIDWHTPLDRVIIRLVRDSHAQVRDGLNCEDLKAVVEELCKLSHSRETSWFHKGFREAMFGDAMQKRTGDDNDERRAWYVTGYLQGSFRVSPEAARTQLLEVNDRDRKALSRPGSKQAAAISKLFVPELLQSDNLAQVARWITAYSDPSIINACIERIRRLLREDRVRDARDLAKSTRGALEASCEAGVSLFGWCYLGYLQAVAIRMLGLYTEAIAEYQQLLATMEELHPIENGEPTDELGWRQMVARIRGSELLARAGIRRLEDLEFQPAGERDAQRDALLAVRDRIDEHLQTELPYPPVALLLSWIVLAAPMRSRPEIEAALVHMDRAIPLMDGSEDDLWRASGLVDRARAWRALLVLALMDQARSESETHELRLLVERGVRPSADIVISVLTECAATGASDLEELAMLYWSDSRVAILRSDALSALIDRPKFRALLLKDPDTSFVGLLPSEKLKILREAVRASADTDPPDTTQLGLCLDEIVLLGRHYRGDAHACLEALRSGDRWKRIWDDDDFDPVEVELLEQSGDKDRAVQAARVLCYRQMNSHSPEADASIDLFEHLGGASDEVAAMRARTEPAVERSAALASDAPKVIVHFIGGDEQQKKMQSRIREIVRGQAPWIYIVFTHPGWSANWGQTLEQVTNQLPNCHIAVLEMHMRTEFGRGLRKALGEANLSWRASRGHGPESIARAIVAAGCVVARSR